MNVFITGVSSGIGWGLAKHYLEKGYNVFGVSRRVPKDFISHPSFRHQCCDLTYFEYIHKSLKKLFRDIEQIDIAILNAGILGEISEMHKQSVSDIKKVMDSNVWSNKEVIDYLLLSQIKVDKIVAISSGASINGNKGWGGYSISKASLNMLIKLYASENPAIGFYALAPGLVDTAMQDYLCGDQIDPLSFPSADKLRDARNTPQMPKPEAIATTLAATIAEIHNNPSGSYVDIRNL